MSMATAEMKPSGTETAMPSLLAYQFPRQSAPPTLSPYSTTVRRPQFQIGTVPVSF